MIAPLARAALAAALSAMTLNAHAGVVTTLLAVPWGLIHLTVTKLSEQSNTATPPTKSAPADSGLNHWVFRNSDAPKLPPVLALAQLQKDFDAAIHSKAPNATITTGALSIPAPEQPAASALTTSGWLACSEPVLEARAEGDKQRRLHVCVTHSQAGLQTAVYVFDPERSRRFATPSFSQPGATAEFLSDPEAKAGELVQQLKAALDKTFGNTELAYTGSVLQPAKAPTGITPAYGN